jgi:hypothetical protein
MRQVTGYVCDTYHDLLLATTDSQRRTQVCTAHTVRTDLSFIFEGTTIGRCGMSIKLELLK